ncbi:hypothetical protein [Sulfuricurvum sp.]|uniref:hypothetical protein n=1 Tax=Sulfuricurvum sp. TaxID=2025608 RepID=UPI002613C77B|nr:hypothetical protein [Sulfuricurvum sp.]MDD2267482.1 hypothetical protein [Sulfuricurvum sp.]MDD2783970.1 hypothetical protein [Sulfuricurvum sp.]
MWDTYEEYCSFMESKGCEPLSEEIFNRDYRRKSEEEKKAEELNNALFVSRKKESFRNVEPTLSNHEAPRATAPLKVNLMDIPKTNHIPEVGKKVSMPKKPTPSRESKEISRRPNAVKKTSLKGMSKEERRVHRNKLSRERRERDKKNGELKPLSEERIIKQRGYAKSHYEKNKTDRLEKLRIKRESMSPEEKKKQQDYMRDYREKNRERVNANARQWKKNKRNLTPQNNTSISPDQSLSA